MNVTVCVVREVVRAVESAIYALDGQLDAAQVEEIRGFVYDSLLHGVPPNLWPADPADPSGPLATGHHVGPDYQHRISLDFRYR